MDQAEFHRTAISKDPNNRIFAIQESSEVFHNFLDKSEAENDLLQLAKDKVPEVRIIAAQTISGAFGVMPNKSRAEKYLLKLAKDKDADVRTETAQAIGFACASIQDIYRYEYIFVWCIGLYKIPS